MNSLMEEDIDSIKMFNLVCKGNISCKLHATLTRHWGHHVHLESQYKLNQRITTLSNVQPVSYDCCINSCCPFIGDGFSIADACPFCQEPRFDACQHAHNIFDYIPL